MVRDPPCTNPSPTPKKVQTFPQWKVLGRRHFCTEAHIYIHDNQPQKRILKCHLHKPMCLETLKNTIIFEHYLSSFEANLQQFQRSF